jgi:hypothetical protein
MTIEARTTLDAFAGDLFLRLAVEGRLVVEAEAADQTIAGLEHTLEVVRARLQVAREHCFDCRRLDLAVSELPKYIEALRRARRPAPTTG